MLILPFPDGLGLNGNIYDEHSSVELEDTKVLKKYVINFAAKWCLINGFICSDGEAS